MTLAKCSVVLAVAVGYTVVVSSHAAKAAARAPMSLQDRIEAQRAIEQVYWSLRIWPEDNPGPKPSLSAVVSDDMLRAKVADYLAKSNALEALWQRPITSEQLQAEMERMAQNTRDGTTLNALFRALRNDPFVIAETLARQTLADRLIRNWYANDARFHREIEGQARAALAACSAVACMKTLGGEYRETRWQRRSDRTGTEGAAVRIDGDVVEAGDWNDRLNRLAALLGSTADSIPIGKLSGLIETSEAFVVTALLSRTADAYVTSQSTWSKRPFDVWWAGIGPSMSASPGEAPQTFTLPASPSAACTDDSWTTTRFGVPDGRAHPLAVWTGSEMIVWGGYDFTRLATGARYDPATDAWTPISTGANAPSGRESATAVWTGTEMIVWGGDVGSASDPGVNTGARYNPTTKTWAPTSTTGAPPPRSRHTAVWTGSVMIVWGGYDGSTGTFLNDGGLYDPTTDSWSPVSTGNAPFGRGYHTAVWTGTRMVVWGGYRDPTGYTNTGGRYDPTTNTWAAVSTALPHAPSPRAFHTAIWSGSEMIVWGGYNGAPLQAGARYNPSTDVWTPTATFYYARYNHTAVWTGTVMIVWGGNRGDDWYTNLGGCYNPLTNTWTTTSLGANNPTVRGSHAAVWTGTEMIIWGGQNNEGFLNTGARYNLAADSWLPTPSTSTVPVGRNTHSAVWTGAEMIVWGGYKGGAYLRTGGRYQPATDTWTPTSVGANFPDARRKHTAIWTGNEMIVWGGLDITPGGTGLATGWRYDPSSDTWIATSTAGDLPTPRYDHTAVWTGTAMIVWGGTGGGARNSGGVYRPATNSWIATSVATGVPAPRFGHTAVWAGSEMIVWGGYDGFNHLNTGGRYNPLADSWSVTSTGAGVPTARQNHTAVWTDTQMVVWGGRGESNVSTGARYIPATDTWAPTSTGANAPTARYNHTATWTGTEMLVWGGIDFTAAPPYLSNAGARYDPATDTWTAMAPGVSLHTQREGHTAVWTGTQMIIWGGNPTDSVGGVYCVCAGPSLYYRDADGDGFGDPGNSATFCAGAIPSGFVGDGSDCNDSDPSIHPGVPEVCNVLDDDCDGTVDNCSDGNACTQTDSCVDGACVGSNPVTCVPSDPCRLVGTCVPQYGTCTNPVAPNGLPCDDGDGCTTVDVCNNGICSGTPGTLPGDVNPVSASKTGAAASFTWPATSGATVYDTLRGPMSDLPVGSVPESEICFDNGAATSVNDPEVPADNSGFWYLVRAQNACGSGGYGFEGSQGAPGAPRSSATCP